MKMKTKLTVTILACLLATAVYAVTNIVITMPLSEAKYTNMLGIVSNKNISLEMFLSNSVVMEIEDQRLSLLIELWHGATPIQQENALQALKN